MGEGRARTRNVYSLHRESATDEGRGRVLVRVEEEGEGKNDARV